VPTAGTPQPFGFTGEVHSAGQVYLRARWYAPGNGTFTSRDPFAGFPELPYSLHAYQYAYSNPVRWTDPSGECVPYPVNPFDPDCRFLGWNPANWNWEDGRAYYYGPAGTIGKMALMALFPPAAYVFGAENAALSYIRYHENPTECNGVLVIVDTTLAVLPFASLVKFGGGAGPMMQGGTQVLTAAQSQLLRLEVATVAVGAGYIPNIFAATTGDGSGDPSGKGSGFRGPAAKAFDWDHIIDHHVPWGTVAQQRQSQGVANSIFENMTETQIKASVKEAWKNRTRVRTQVDPATGETRVLYRGSDAWSGYTIEMWFNQNTKIVETAYPLK
jgi:RHS repeat-associated protein